MGIKKDIQELLDKQIIDQVTADRLHEYYHSKERKIDVSSLLMVVAALLVASGVISIIGYNWDSFPKAVRLVLAHMPLVLATCLSCYVLAKKSDKRPWMEATAIIQSFAFAASFAWVSQIYQLQSDTNAFVLTWLLTSLPFIFLFRSAGLSIVVIGFLCYAIDYHSDAQTIWASVVILLADVAFLYLYYYRWGETFLCRLRVVMLPVVGFFIYSNLFSQWIEWWCYQYLWCVASSLFYVAYRVINESDRIACRGLALKLAFCFVFFLSIIVISEKEYVRDASWDAMAVLAIGVVVDLVYRLCKRQIPHWQEYVGVVFGFAAMAIGPFPAVSSVLSLLLIGYALYESCVKYDIMEINASVIALAVWVIWVLAKFQLPYYVVGLVLIAMGIALIFVNRYIIEKKRGNEIKAVK